MVLNEGTHTVAGAEAEAQRAARFDEVRSSEALPVTRLAFLLVRSQAVAEELAQDAFLRLYERFDRIEKPAGFLRTVVIRLAITWLRRHEVERRRLAVAGSRHSREQRSGGASEIDEIWETSGELRPERRTVLVLRFYEDLSQRQIADLLGCSAATVRSRVRRALNDLREELEREGDRPISGEAELTARLAAAFSSKAEQVTALRRAFRYQDLARLAAVLPAGEAAPPPPDRDGRRPWWAVAAAAVVVVLAIGGVAVITRGRGADRATDGVEPERPKGPPGELPVGLLAPGSPPEGMRLWSVSWSQEEQGLFAEVGTGQLQMFAGSGEGSARVLVSIRTNGGTASSGEPVTVRGQAGSASSGEGSPDALSTVGWSEGDGRMLAWFSGMAQDQAVAFLDSLAWRSGDVLEGFAPPEGDVSLVGETIGLPETEVLVGTFVYSPGDTPTSELTQDSRWVVNTTSAPEAAADQGTFSSTYLWTWFRGTREDDGTVVSFTPEPDGSFRLIDAEGNMVSIDSFDLPIDEAAGRRVADSVASLSERELERLQRSVNGRVAELPLISSVNLPSARLEVRGRGNVNVLCIDVTGADPTCPIASGLDSAMGTGPLTTGLLIDGTWYVAAVVAGETPSILEVQPADQMPAEVVPLELAEVTSGDRPSMEDVDLVSETGRNGKWSFSLALLPADMELVTVWFGDPDLTSIMERPKSPR